jgi:hypothetical protein
MISTIFAAEILQEIMVMTISTVALGVIIILARIDQSIHGRMRRRRMIPLKGEGQRFV